jgi:hypothetical protein
MRTIRISKATENAPRNDFAASKFTARGNRSRKKFRRKYFVYGRCAALSSQNNISCSSIDAIS